jgi:hypothetical protein
MITRDEKRQVSATNAVPTWGFTVSTPNGVRTPCLHLERAPLLLR